MAMEMIADVASTPVPTSTTWTPQDDLLLKNSIEAGASLEALAKGAVRFSQRYNINELRHRWRSLLYDPDVSVEASASMFSLERSAADSPIKTNRFGTKSNLGECPLKRKLGTIRSQYNAMRKKISRQVLNSIDGVLDGMQSEEFMKECGGSLRQNELCEDMNQIHGDNLVNCNNCSVMEEIGQSHAQPDMPIWMGIDGVTVSTMPLHENLGNKVQIAKDTFIRPNELNGPDFVNHPESRIDLPNEEEVLYMNIDGKDTMEKSCDDNLDLLLLSSPSAQEDDEPIVHQPPKLDSRDNIAPSTNCMPNATVDAVTDLSNPVHGDIINSVSHPEMEIHSSEAAKHLCASELNDEYMFCTLNSEDTEIPCNDNIYPLSWTAAIYREAIPLPLMTTNQQNNEPEVSLKEEDHTPRSFMASQVCRSDTKPDVPPSGSLCAGGRTALLDCKHFTTSLRQGSNFLANQSQSRLADANLKTSSDRPAQQEEIGATAREFAKLEIGNCKTPHLEASSASLEPRDSDSDDDVPYFDEVEAMILEMDLCPMDEDSHATGEVSRFQHIDSKRAIMRLEQCSQSYIKRAIASQGALAVLYGRHMKQYIKKSEVQHLIFEFLFRTRKKLEVILGRATEDIHVDIDLRREGPANKVSRKQALIKMEGNGSFLLKNLGKSSIFLNGKEVGPGQLLSLCSGSLIEIRDMAFIFEINDKSIRKFLENEAKRE